MMQRIKALRSLNCRAVAALQTEHHIPEDFSLQQHGCVRSLPHCPEKELFKKYGLESGIFNYNYSENAECDASVKYSLLTIYVVHVLFL